MDTTDAKSARLADLSAYDLQNPRDLSRAVAAMFDAKKGRDISIIDLAGKTAIADYFVIVSCNSTVAVKALYEYMEESLSRCGIRALHTDADKKWIAVDYGSVIVHIFYEELREFYRIERLWADGTNLKHFNE
ncbi:MAG: ribosome silencing factor [Clostridiales bacterium]|jgi:ribosome-associated protein|nr:ribosome silencing factor [Clostridiales bacterium]